MSVEPAIKAPEPAMPKIGCVNHDCDKCKAQAAVEPEGYVYAISGVAQGALIDKTLKVGTPLYTSPQPTPGAQAEIDSLREQVRKEQIYDYQKREAMKLALELIKDDLIEDAIAALEKELSK